MSATLNFSLKTLELFLNKEGKVVYRDGGANVTKILAIWGTLVAYDSVAECWRGYNNARKEGGQFLIAINHEDVNRRIINLSGGKIT